MTTLDYAKALGVALLLMVVNVAVSFGVMWVYGTFIDTGHEPAYYEAAAQRIAPWSSVVAGAFLFGLAGWLFAKRQPERNGVAFALTFTGAYVVVDLAIVYAAGAFGALGGIVAASMLTKFGAAFIGAYVAKRAKAAR